MKMSHIVASFLLFTCLVTLVFGGYKSIEDYYGFEPQDLRESKTVMEQLKDVRIIDGVKEFTTGVFKLANPSGLGDIWGAMKAIGIGMIDIATGVLTFPVEIMAIISDFYSIPPIISIIFGLLITLYVGFILVKKYTGG